MDTIGTISSKPARTGRRALTFSKAGGILWDCAWEALILAFLVQIFGSIAFGMASGIWRQLVPSPPPIPERAMTAEVSEPSAWDFSPFENNRLALIALIIFATKAGTRLVRYSPSAGHRKVAAQAQRIVRKISEEWFELVVINALLASVGVAVLQLSQQFSLTSILWEMAGGLVRAALELLTGVLPATGAAERWVGWYQENQAKFMFWLLYSAAICDDLGLPNYKRAAGWFWRRLSKGRARPGRTRKTEQEA